MYNCNKIVTGISCNLSLGLSDSLALLRFVEEKLDSIKWTALLDGILSPCLNNAINHCNSNMWRGKRRGGGGGWGQVLDSNPHVTNYYISLAEILLVTRIHSSQTINI